MISERRSARRTARATVTPDPSRIPPDLAAGPCMEVWGDGGNPLALCEIHVTLRRWHEARDEWMHANGLNPQTDYRHLPPELRDRAPYSRNITVPWHTNRG